MTVLTRSQCKKQTPINVKPVIHKKTDPEIYKIKIKPDLNNLLPWFTSVSKQKLTEWESLTIIRSVTHDMKERRIQYFDIIRCVSELFYFVDQYILDVKDLCLPKLINTIYNKIYELHDQLSCVPPKTHSDHNSVKVFLNIIQDLEKTLTPLIDKTLRLPPLPKPKRSHMDYSNFNYTNETCYAVKSNSLNTNNHIRFIYTEL